MAGKGWVGFLLSEAFIFQLFCQKTNIDDLQTITNLTAFVIAQTLKNDFNCSL
jgi:hypothetical protein